MNKIFFLILEHTQSMSKRIIEFHSKNYIWLPNRVHNILMIRVKYNLKALHILKKKLVYFNMNCYLDVVTRLLFLTLSAIKNWIKKKMHKRNAKLISLKLNLKKIFVQNGRKLEISWSFESKLIIINALIIVIRKSFI